MILLCLARVFFFLAILCRTISTDNNHNSCCSGDFFSIFSRLFFHHLLSSPFAPSDPLLYSYIILSCNSCLNEISHSESGENTKLHWKFQISHATFQILL